jgi:uncharacterized membrane protein YphA (DoxX/SURF4 family)
MGAPVPTKRRAVTVVLWTIQLLLVATFVFVAMQKLFGYPSSVRTFSKIGLGQWFRYVTGSVELTGAIGLLIPRLSGLAALGLVGVMISATITNLLVLYPAMVALNALLGVAAALIARVRWAETKALVEYVRR